MTLALTPEKRAKRFEFLQRRQEGIGGSDVPVIIGLSPYKNAVDIYYEKTRPISEEDIEDDNIHQLRGHSFEAMALAHYWLKTGRRGRRVSTPTRHPDYPNVVVNIDFDIFADPDRPEGMQGPGVGETKSPIKEVFRKVHEHGLRDTELVQLQTNIAVARREWGSFNYFNMEDSNGPVLPLDQVANEEMGAFLLSNAQRFWNEHVVPRIPPDPTEWRLMERKDAPKIVDLSGERVTLPTDDAFARQARRLLDCKDTYKEAEKRYRELQDVVFEQLRETGVGKAHIPGSANLTVVTKAGRKGFDVKRLANHLALDRDKVERWLQDWRVNGADIGVEDIGRLLFECVLDLSVFETEGDPSQYLLANRTSEE